MPVKHPKVAVLLAAYNGMQWIEEQLASILGQSAVDVTVYISIDPSTDGTEAWCAAYAAQASRCYGLACCRKLWWRIAQFLPIDP